MAPIYVDENGQQVNPNEVGTNYEIDNNQQNKNSTPNLLASMIQQEEKVKNFITQTSPSGNLTDLNYILQGFVYDENTRSWIKISDGIPECVRLDFLQFITPDLSENVRMTNLSKQQINGVMLSTIEWVKDYLMTNADTMNLSEEQMTKIGLIMIKAVFFTLLRSQEGVERSKIFKSLTLGAEVNPQEPKQEKQKFFQFWR